MQKGLWWICVLFFALINSFFLYGNEYVINLLPSFKSFLDPLFIYFFASRLQRDNDKKAAIDGIVLGLVLFSFHLIIQSQDVGGNIRAGGLFNQANAAAAFIAAYAPILLVIFDSSGKIAKKIMYMIFFIVCIAALLKTVSRGGVVGLGIGLLFTAIYSKGKIIKTAILLSILAVLVIPSILPETIVSRFEGKSITGDVNDLEAQVSSDMRSQVWKASFSMIASNPIGVGLDGFLKKIGNYGPLSIDAHNAYLRVWGEMGTQGIFVFLGLLIALFKRGWLGMNAKGDEVARLSGTALTASMLCLCATNFFSATMLYSLVVSYLAVLAAISCPTTHL